MAILLLVALAIWSVLLASTLLDLPHLRDVLPARPPPDAPEVAIIVPARDEAHQIAACLRSLLSQDWPRFKVICVDDRSTDGTFEVASAMGDPRLEVVRGEELPAGWLGKNHANAQGVLRAGAASWLLFTDADTVHAPAALASAFGSAQRAGADLFTIFTDVRAESFWERLLLPHVLSAVVAMFPARMVNDPRSPLAIANGQYLLIKRAVYDAAGGHAAIRDRVADDLELARLVKAAGRRLRVENGRKFVSVRMYMSLRDLWWGFVKNASAGVGGPLLALAAVPFLMVTVLPFFAWPFLRGPTLLLALAACAVALGQRLFLFARLFPVNPAWALSLPIAAVVFTGIVLHSAVRQLTGRGPIWKGREYPYGR